MRNKTFRKKIYRNWGSSEGTQLRRATTILLRQEPGVTVIEWQWLLDFTCKLPVVSFKRKAILLELQKLGPAKYKYRWLAKIDSRKNLESHFVLTCKSLNRLIINILIFMDCLMVCFVMFPVFCVVLIFSCFMVFYFEGLITVRYKG